MFSLIVAHLTVWDFGGAIHSEHSQSVFVSVFMLCSKNIAYYYLNDFF